MIFVANNCDALSALKILTVLLKQSGIQYTWIPVFGYGDIENNLKEDVLPSEIKSLIFLNWGAKLDFTQYWFYKQETDIKTFVFDALRPVYHNNILTQKAVYVIDDGDIELNECPDDADLEAYEDDIEEKEENSIVDGEKEYQLIINGGKKLSAKSEDGEGDEEEKKSYEEDKEEDKEEDNFDLDLIGKKRKRSIDLNEADNRTKRQLRIANYYSGEYYSKSWSYLLYSLGVQLNKQTVDSFWLWILGLTDQLIHSRITSFQYDEILGDCQKEYISISNQNFNQENNSLNSNIQNNPQDVPKKFDSKGILYSAVDLDTDNINVGSILPQHEFRFMFLRSWTLYKSIFYSNYIVSKLKLWEDSGKRELAKFFATLGVPPDEYNQQYKFMNIKYKNILKSKITEIAPKFDLDHILFSSFIRQIDNKTQMNASDMVYAITSLIESPRSVLIDNVHNIEDQKNTKSKDESTEDSNYFQNQENIRKMQEENFWAAYSALDIKNTSHINYGVELSKEMQAALMSQGILLITNKKIRPCTKFRYWIISNDTLAASKIFQYPMAIQKLALFIMDVYKESRNRMKLNSRQVQDDLPMVVWIKNSERESYLVAGVLGRDAKYTRNKNDFGRCFQEAAEKVGATYKHDGFDTSLIEIKNEHFEDFLDELIQL